MKQIYDFEENTPPILNKNILYSKLEKKKLRRQTAILAFAGILFQFVVAFLGFIAFDTHPIVTLFCFLYVLISATSSSVIAIVCSRKGGILL